MSAKCGIFEVQPSFKSWIGSVTLGGRLHSLLLSLLGKGFMEDLDFP
jgi:hypothetical protein